MTKQLRKASVTGVYHVMMQGIDHMRIFESDEDYKRFIHILHQSKKQKAEKENYLPVLCEFYAYALMSNRVHLLLKVNVGTISETIKRIAISYVSYFNGKYYRSGALFQGRFRSEPCEDLPDFMLRFRYIHQLPVKEELVTDIKDYPFTSWQEYTRDEVVINPICQVKPILECIESSRFEKWVCESTPDMFQFLDKEVSTVQKVSDELLLEHLKNQFRLVDATKIQHMDKPRRNEVLRFLIKNGGGIRQLNRLTGVGRKIIERIAKEKERPIQNY